MARLLIAANGAAMFRDFLNPFAAHFRDLGWEVDAMACDAKGSPECAGRYDETWNVEWSRNPLSAANVLRAPGMVRRVIQARDYDLVHVHTPIPAFVTRYALRNLRPRRPRVVYTAHGFHFHDGGSIAKNRVFRELERLAGPWTDYLVVINRADEDAAKKHRIVPPDRLVYMPGIGIDTERFRPNMVRRAEVAGVRRELGLAASDRLFLMIAEFTSGKRHRDALQALAKLQRRSAYMAFAGYGPLENATRRLAHQCGVEQRVRFLGFRRDIPALLRAADALVLPSEREGLPRSIMEALAMETPAIGTNIRGTRDLLGGGAGLLVEVGDITGLCDAMQWVLEHPIEAEAMTRRGAQRTHHYELRNIIRRHEYLYSQALRESLELSHVAGSSVGPRR